MDASHELLSTIIALFGVVPLLVAAEDELLFTRLTRLLDEFTAVSGTPLVAIADAGRLMLEFRLVLMLALPLLFVAAPLACVS